MNLLDKLKSRKLWLTVLACAGYVALGATGHVAWDEVASKIQWIVVAYLGMQGYADSKKQ